MPYLTYIILNEESGRSLDNPVPCTELQLWHEYSNTISHYLNCAYNLPYRAQNFSTMEFILQLPKDWYAFPAELDLQFEGRALKVFPLGKIATERPNTYRFQVCQLPQNDKHAWETYGPNVVKSYLKTLHQKFMNHMIVHKHWREALSEARSVLQLVSGGDIAGYTWTAYKTLTVPPLSEGLVTNHCNLSPKTVSELNKLCSGLFQDLFPVLDQAMFAQFHYLLSTDECVVSCAIGAHLPNDEVIKATW